MLWNPIRLAKLHLSSTGLSLFGRDVDNELNTILYNAHLTVFDSITDGVLVLDQDNFVVSCNPSAKRIIRAVSSQPVTDRLDNQHVDSVLSMWPALGAYFTSTTRDLSTSVSSCSHGVLRSFEINITPITDHDGQFTGRVILLHETTERDNAAKALRQRKQQLRHMVERLQHMDHNQSSHIDALDDELRRSLTRIDLQLNNLREDVSDGLDDAINRLEEEIASLYHRFETILAKDSQSNLPNESSPLPAALRSPISIPPTETLVQMDR